MPESDVQQELKIADNHFIFFKCMKKTILALTVLLISGVNLKAQTYSGAEVSYRFIVNDIPSGYNYPLVGLINNVRGDHSSIQLGFINSNAGRFEGVQAGFINSIGANVKGGQVGFINSVDGEYTGIQWGFINSIGGKLDGIQVGFINSSYETKGIQAGFINSTDREVTGLQAGFINSSKKSDGMQAGFLNSTQMLKGLQIGFINSVDRVERGLPIGFLSFVKYGGYKAIEISKNNISPFNIAFKTGVREFYTYPLLAYNKHAESNKLSLGFGFGSNLDYNRRWFINPEYEGLNQLSTDFNHYSTFRFNFGYSLSRRLELIAGPSLIWHVKINREDFGKYPTNFAKNELIAGYNFALRYKLR